MAVGAVLVAGAALAACGDDDAPPAPDRDAACAVAGEDGHVAIVAEDLAWDVDCLVVRADAPVTIEVDNQDEGVSHNLQVTDAPGDPGTELDAGPVVQLLQLELPAGTYRYVCDIHPTMVGTLEAVSRVPR